MICMQSEEISLLLSLMGKYYPILAGLKLDLSIDAPVEDEAGLKLDLSTMGTLEPLSYSISKSSPARQYHWHLITS